MGSLQGCNDRRKKKELRAMENYRRFEWLIPASDRGALDSLVQEGMKESRLASLKPLLAVADGVGPAPDGTLSIGQHIHFINSFVKPIVVSSASTN